MLPALFFDPISERFFNSLFHSTIKFTTLRNYRSLEFLKQLGIYENRKAFFPHANHINGSIVAFIRILRDVVNGSMKARRKR